MKKDIKDYLHFYIGCDYVEVWKGVPQTKKVYKLTGTKVDMVTNGGGIMVYIPILRQLSSMTKEERLGVCASEGGPPYDDDLCNAARTAYLIFKHFDVFGLHEAGLCLYQNEKGELY